MYAVVSRCVLVVLLGTLPASVQGREPVTKSWTVDGLERQALVYVPEQQSDSPAPLVFGFHGHGGNMRQAARSFRMHEEWPEAIVVYMQGVPTPGQLTDPEGKKNGWQKSVGDQADRDLKFFDAVLASVRKEYRVDDERIYSMGHSNGGGFTYLLWAARGDAFAAVAPSGALSVKHRNDLKPKPVLHVAGENDPLVRFAWQEAMLEVVKKVNQCEDGKPWKENATVFPSRVNTPLVTFITSEGHRFPQAAPRLIVTFFREHTRSESVQP
ncbi:MAG: dienelactone hydrolase family protein [Planctomycetaceae bacterium]|nr:dienelactone hydrolase family protein [Planctomycetaceae bacterium]